MPQRRAGLAMAVLVGVWALPPMVAQGAEAPAVVEADKAAFGALPDAERRAIQEDLVWTGDFSGTASGLYGPRTREAIVAFNTRLGLPAAGLLDATTRKRLAQAADKARKDVGFAVVNDARAGLRIGLPLKLVPKRAGTDQGSRFSGTDNGVVVDTVARPAGEGGLPEVFARMSAAGPARTIAYKLLKPEFFVVSGDAGERKFYARFEAGTVADIATLRGFTITYPKAAAKALDPVALAVAGSFVAFPDVAAPPPPLKTAPAQAVARQEPTRGGEAVVVAPGVALARLSRADCPGASVGGAPASWRLVDPSSGLALLDAPTVAGAPVALALAPAADGAIVTALFRGEGGAASGDGASVATAELRTASAASPATVTLPLPAGAGGAFLFDRSGALVGLTKPPARRPVTVAGVTLAAPYGLSDALELAKVVRAAGLEPAPPHAPRSHDGADAPGPTLLSVTCGGGVVGTP